MNTEQIPGENDQADMAGTSMSDLPGTDADVDVDVDSEEEDEKADAMEDAQEDAAHEREDEGGYQ
ncbi:hypothetical protein [Sphingobium sp. ba1]|jgi:hypothetical protein|uniref:hypothetical protein n=1 Tax=Sphingobium sp. ba1 TaxID=1522072 RepID=UPI00056285DE|nr:hypothetical protein [Sphingobium sp. ba1]